MFIFEGLQIKNAGKKGRGVFTSIALPANVIIEESPVLVLNPDDRSRVEQTLLNDYIFEWGEKMDEAAIGLGYISIYNHASPSNCEYIMDYENQTMRVQTMKAIKEGEELTINYSAGWNDWQPVWFEEA